MRVLVLGGYGLIGLGIARTLHTSGLAVTGAGRSARTGERLYPAIRWISADLASLLDVADWKVLLESTDVVVNAAGVLQDSPQDDLARIHDQSIRALAGACAETGRVRLIQISAPGAATDSSTQFMRSKARADQAIKESGIDWFILRPGLVLGPAAYGGSALLRSLAAFPVVLPLALADRRIRTVALHDVARVVLECVEGKLPSRIDVDLVESHPHTLQHIVESLRAWMGVAPAKATFSVPRPVVSVAAKVADLLGYLGWRSPLRTTTMRALEDEVRGDPAPLHKLRDADLDSLDRTLAALPVTVQERWFARLYLLKPVMIGTLAAFWIASGAIGVNDLDRTARTIPTSVLPHDLSSMLAVAGAAIDITLGAAILYRPSARWACLAMVAVSLLYLAAGTILTPALWLDPLGPFVKVVPALVLALTTMAVLEER